MPATCVIESHTGGHEWPAAGSIRVLGCERQCQLCVGDRATKMWNSASSIRRHVLSHLKGTSRTLMAEQPGQLALGYQERLAKGGKPPKPRGIRGQRYRGQPTGKPTGQPTKSKSEEQPTKTKSEEQPKIKSEEQPKIKTE